MAVDTDIAPPDVETPDIPEQTPPPQQPPDKVAQYYDYLKKAGADVAPSLDSFKKTLSTDSTARQYYGYLRQHHFDAPPNYGSFARTLGIDTTAAPPTGQPSAQAVPALPEHHVAHTPIQDIRHLNELANQPVGKHTVDPQGGLTEDNPEDVTRNKGYQDQYEKAIADQAQLWGTDPKATKQAIEGFPGESDETKLKTFAGLAKDNPVFYSRLKSANDIRQAIATNGPEGINDANAFNHLQTAGSYEQLQDNIAMQQEIMRKHGLGQQYFEKLKDSQAPLINTLDPGLHIQYWNSDDRKLGLSEFQYAGLETEKMFNPGKYQQDLAIIKHNQGLDEGATEVNPIPTGKKGYAYDRGVENVLYQLENQGRQNTSKFIDQRRAELGKDTDDLVKGTQEALSFETDPNEHKQMLQDFQNHPLIQEAAKLDEGQQSIDYARTEDQRRFPLNYGDQATRLVKDAMSTTNGWAGVGGKQVLLGAGESSDNTIRFVKNTFINLLGSEEANADNAASNIGHQALTELAGYEGAAYSMQQAPLLVGDGLVKKVQDTFNNPNLSTEEKNQQATDLIRNNEGEIKANPKAGQQNITGKAILYTATNTMGQILGIADQSLLMGGLLGDAAKAQQMANALVPMYASTQNQLYEQALARGEEKPLLKSHLDAAIISLASLINPDIKVVKGMVGAETGIGKMIAGVDAATWNKVLTTNRPLVDRMLAGTKATARQLRLANLQYGLIVPTAQYLVHKNILNEDPNLGDTIKDGLLQTNISMALPALFHGGWGFADNPKANPMQKYSIVEAGLHPKENIELINHLVEKGQIPPDRADQIKEVIKHAGDILVSTPGVKSDGTPMTETEVADVAYQMLRKKILESKLKNMPEPLKPAIEEKIHAINQEVAELHTSEADKHKTDLNRLLTENIGRIKDNIPVMEGQVREAIKRNEPETVFKEIYDQAMETKKVDGKEISSRAATEELFGKALLDKAIDLHNPKTEIDASKTKTKAEDAQAGNARQVTEKPGEGAAAETKAPVQSASSFLESRHADTIHDEQGIVSGPNNKELSAKGKRDANDLARDVEGKGVTSVITSGLERSKETGDRVAGKIGAKVENRPELNTWDIKDFDGLSDKEFKDIQEWFVQNPDNTVYQGPLEKFKGKEVGESVNEYAGRIIPAMERVEKESGPETLLINHSNNMMLWDAYKKNGREWNEQARQDYLQAEKPEPATLTNRPEETTQIASKSYIPEKLKIETVKPRDAILVKDVPLSDIKISSGVRSRIEERIAKGIKSGNENEPVALKYNADGTIDLLDGAHRFIQAEQRGDKTIDARIMNVEQDYEQFKPQSDAIQEPSAGGVLQHPQEGAGSQGSERGGVEPGQQGQAAPGEAGGQGEGQEPPGGAGGPPLSEDNPFRENTEDLPNGIKKAISMSIRAEWKLPEIALPKLGTEDQVLRKGKAAVDSGAINPREVARRVTETNGIYTPAEGGAMLYYGHQLMAAEKDLRGERKEADDLLKKDPDNTAAFYAKITAEQRLGQLDDEIELKTRSDRMNSRAWGNLGNVMQIETDDTFSPSRVKATIEENYGGNMPKAVEEKLEKAFAERDEAIAEMKKAKEKVALLEMQKDAEGDKPKQSRVGKMIQEKKEILKKERIDLIEQLKQAIKKDTGNLGANPLPIHTVEAVSKLALNYFKDGVLTIEGITNKIYEDLKDVVEGIDKKQIREAIVNYQPLARAQGTEKALKKAASHEVDILRLESRRKTDPEVKMELPEKRPIINFEKDTDYIKAKQRLVNAEFKIKQEKMKSYASQESRLSKTLGWANRLMRLSILSGVRVLEKLAAAATIGSAAQKPMEEVLNGIWGKAFSKISEKADADMGLNLLAVGRYYSHFFNLAEFARDAKDIVTSGESRLGKELEKQHFDHIPILDLPTDLHQVIKGPAKRATFEYALTKILADQQAKGIDINHPLVLESARQRAFARAKYEIFMEDNKISRMFGKWEAEWKDQGKLGAGKSFLLHFVFPVSKVPTNIARRVGLSIAGLPIGLGKAAEAYRKGIDNLSTDEANAIGRALTKGTIGSALWMAGFFGYKSLGGLYSSFDPNKQRKNEPLADEMKLLGQPISKPWQHALPLEVMQMGATFRHIYEKTKTKQGDAVGIAEATGGSLGAILEQIPVVETPVNLITATQDPYHAKKLGEDLKRRFEPQLLVDLGIIPPPNAKPPGRTGRTGGRSRQ